MHTCCYQYQLNCVCVCVCVRVFVSAENIRVPEHFDVPARQFTWSAFVTIMISSIVLGFAIWTVLLKGKTAEGDERAEKKPKSVEERLEHLESIKKYLPEAKYNQKIDEILKGI